MRKTTIYYYTTASGENPFARFLDSLEKRQQSKILRIIIQIKEYGLLSITPHIKKLSGTPLWEIRILGKDNIRIIYVTQQQSNVLVLNEFIKKTQKTSSKELEIAIHRLQDWQNRS